MNYGKHGSRTNLSCKKQMTVYLNKFEHIAMERLFEIFNHISDIVSSTQNALELLQKSRKEIRDIINNEFDEMIERITSQKMELLQLLSCKYHSKCKKLQTQLTFMKLHRRLISQKKKEFESISLNRCLSEIEREKNLMQLTNAQIKKLNESLNGKKIIISSSINIQSLSFSSSNHITSTRKRSANNHSLSHSIKECLNVMRHIKIVSFDNKRDFEELYGEILIPLKKKIEKKDKLIRSGRKLDKVHRKRCSVTNVMQLSKKKKKKKKKKRKKEMKRKVINIEDDVTSDGQIIRDSDDPDDDLCAAHDTKCIRLKLIDTETISSSMESTSSLRTDDSNDEEAEDTENIIVNESETDSSSIICIERKEKKEEDAQNIEFINIKTAQRKKKANRNNPSYSIPSQSKSKSTVQTPPVIKENNAQRMNKKSKMRMDKYQEDTKLDEIAYNDELKDMEEELDCHISNKIRAKYGELCSFSCALKSYGIGLTNNNKVAHKNHGNFNEDYVLLDIEHNITKNVNEGVKCFRFHHNLENYALWGVVSKNNENKCDIKHFWGCSTENSYIKNGSYIHNKIKTEQWCGKLVDLMVDLNVGQLKFCSPNFIEPKLTKNKLENEQLNQTIILNGIDTTKTWCVILKLKHKDTFVMVREIPIQWFGKYPKALQFDTFTQV